MCCVPLHHDPGGASQAEGGVAAIAFAGTTWSAGFHPQLTVTAFLGFGMSAVVHFESQLPHSSPPPPILPRPVPPQAPIRVTPPARSSPYHPAPALRRTRDGRSGPAKRGKRPSPTGRSQPHL